MPKERKASVICCGLFRFSRGPSPSSGSIPSGSGNCASSSSAFSSRRLRTTFSSSFQRATSSLTPASSISAMEATAANSIVAMRSSSSSFSFSPSFSLRGSRTAASRAAYSICLRESFPDQSSLRADLSSSIPASRSATSARPKDGPWSPPARSWAASMVSKMGERAMPCSAFRNE